MESGKNCMVREEGWKVWEEEEGVVEGEGRGGGSGR